MKYINKFESFDPESASDTSIPTSQRIGKIVYTQGVYVDELRRILDQLNSAGDEIAYFLLRSENDLLRDGYDLIDIDPEDPYYLEFTIGDKKTYKKITEWINNLFNEKMGSQFSVSELNKFMKNYIIKKIDMK